MVFSTNRSYLSEKLGGLLDQEETLSPESQKLTVRRDTVRRRGKVVTVVEGFAGTNEDLEALGKKLKQACGAGGSVKDGELLIQGDVTDKAASLLLEWGYVKTKARK